MFVFKPITITDSIMTSTIPEPDTGETLWNSGTTYSIGDQVYKVETHRIYESAADNNTDDPLIGVSLVPATWINVGPTNKYAMFDEKALTQSVATGETIIEITPDTVINSLACFNIKAGAVNVTITEPSVGEVYNHDVNLRDNSQVFNWYSYFFEPIIDKTEFLLSDLPSYKKATIKVTFDSGVDESSVGVLVLGRQIELGVAEYGSSFSLNDYSRKETDEFGDWTIIRRGTSKTVDFDGFTQTQRTQYLFARLAELSTIPSVWYGSGTEIDSTVVYGYYKDGLITISNPSTSKITISVEGLV